MALWNEIKSIFSEDVSLTELTDPSRAGARLREFLLLVRETVRSIRRDDAFTLASALAYKTLLSLVPILAIGLAVVAMLEPPEAVPQAAAVQADAGEHVVAPAPSPALPATPHASGEEAPPSYTDSFIQVIKDRIPDFEGRDSLIESIRGFAANARAIFGIGFLFLFWTAFSLLSSMETSFNAIWQVKERRRFLSRLTAFLATLVIVPVLMSLSVYLTTGVARMAEDIEDKIPLFQKAADAPAAQATSAVPPADADSGMDAAGIPAADASATGMEASLVKRVALGLTSLLTTSLAMTALFYLLPYTIVRVRAALTGGFVSGCLFELAMYLFRYYASHLAVNYTKIYGPLLAIPLFLLWVWLVWVIVLLGAEVAFTVQNFRDLAARAELERRGISSRIYLAVRVVLTASAYFHRGESPTNLVDRVSEELEIPPYMIREIVSVLVQESILRRVVPAGEDAYLPAKDISALTVSEVIRAVSADTLDVPEAPDDLLRRRLAEMFGKADAAMQGLLGSCTMAELVAVESRSRLDAETRKLNPYT